MNQQTLQIVILQNQRRLSEEFPTTGRHLRMEAIPRKASVLIGIRRCGKSTYIRKLLSETIEDKTLVCWFDFADDRLVALQNEEPAQIADAYYQLFPEHHEKTVCFFFDEIQLVKNWALFVNRLQNTENCRIFITGNTSFMHSVQFPSELASHMICSELFPYSFTEYLSAQGLSSPLEILSNPDKKHAFFRKYMQWGGFPELFYINDEMQKTRYLQNLALDVITRDIAMRYKIQDMQLLHTLMLMLLGNMAKSTTVNKLKQRLSGLHYSTSSDWLTKYLAYFEDAYLIFTVEILSPNSAVRAVNPKKLYCVDHALALASDLRLFENTGAILENIVFSHLRRTTSEIHYYKTEKGYEIDFVTGTEGNLALYQVCADLSDEETRARELRAVKSACEELSCDFATIITEGETDTVQLDGCTIQIVAAADWTREMAS